MTSTTAKRIREGMELRGIKQSELAEKTGISKGALSSYLSERYLPKQNNIFLIAKALNVSEAWLMGGDVPIERIPETQANAESSISASDTQLFSYFHQLNSIGKSKVIDYAADLTKLPNYTEPEAEDNTESNPISEEPVLIAAHNGHAEEPGQLELMNRDVALAKEIHRIIHSKQ